MNFWLKALLTIPLVSACSLLLQMEAKAQSSGYDLSFMRPDRTQSVPIARFNQYDLSSLRMGSNSGTFGNVSRPTLRQSVALPTNRGVALSMAESAILADGSVDGSPIPSGKFDYGFPKNGPRAYNGIYNTQRRARANSSLPQVSTSSVDISVCDESGLRSSGGGGGFDDGSGAGGSEGGSGSQGPPPLPPGWAGVMCHGVYAGAIPPGGTVEAFWRGEYGFAGDAAQQAALLEEGKWLLENGQIGP